MTLNKTDYRLYYQALVSRDPSHKGKFITAVKTTGIYCLNTCYARKPKFENVDFYATIDQAERAGYRACKLCKPKLSLTSQA